MDRVTIIPLKSVNGVPFGAKKEEVRKVLGSDYENSLETIEENKDVFEMEEVKKVEETFKELYKHMGKNPEDFEWPDISEFEEDNDTYNLVQIEYEDDKFVSATVYAHNAKHLTIGDNDCSDLELAKILTLATDFEWIEEDTSWVSKSKQVGLYCPEDKYKIDSITFGCPGYYNQIYDEE
ncbi:MAG: hypothetical protein IKO57_07470 [Treponema sp.]|nr:hypothetical protein [Treponema sp.]